MDNEKEVRDANNMPIGWVRDVGDKLMAFHRLKNYVGYYWKNTDTTYDIQSRIYCRGDGTVSLIRDADREQ
ncbi:MAG: hypothetical protein IJJ00_06320 [Erysipelotrichaceae bacterium]|nr:hypothetical protein [Erysipelotrichaceae bacterium]